MDNQVVVKTVCRSYLREENRILRSKLPDRITVTARERARLVRFGRRLGSRLGTAINEVITIVSPRTFARWAAGGKPRRRSGRTPGRPRTAESIRDLVLRLARETGWGYTRILGEWKKLGVGSVSRSTVINILREAGLDPGPKRGVGTWTDFLARHAATLWASDFLTVKTWTTRGVVDVFVLFFLHPGSRTAFVAGVTASPTPDWLRQQARNASMRMEELGLPPRHVIIDYDGKYTRDFHAVFVAEGATVHRVGGPKAPNRNAHAERFAQTLRHELLDHVAVFGEKHLRHLLTEFLTHDNGERPHQGIGNVPLAEEPPAVLPFPRGRVRRQKRLGGLLRHYRRAAA